MAEAPPPPAWDSSPPHAPPLPFTRSRHEPVRVYPPESGRSKALAALQSHLPKTHVAVVGLLSTSSSSSSRAVAFANRVIGRFAFDTSVNDVQLPASIHLFYDDVARCIYLLGVSQSENLSFCSFLTPKSATLNSSKTKAWNQRRKTNARDFEDQNMQLKEAPLMQPQVRAVEREKLKMQALLYSSCHLIIVLNDNPRVTTDVLKQVRALAAEKSQLLKLVPPPNKHWKRRNSQLKAPACGAAAGNAFAPGRCVPLVLFAVPALDESFSTRGSEASRLTTVSYCKALEKHLTALFRSLPGNPVGVLRMRDALSAANRSKERRVFNLDPTHCVVVVSRRTATADGRAEAQLERLLDALDSGLSLDDMLKDASRMRQSSANDDDMEFQRLHQYVHKYLHLLFSFSPSASKDSCGCTELLNPLQWVKAFHGLVKDYSSMDSKRLREAAAFEAAEHSQATNCMDPVILAPY